MVKVAGPMMSLSASGTLADAITFSTWKGRPYVRERVIPSNPKSGDQVGRRVMFSFLTQDWSLQSAGGQATWQDLAEQLIVSRFNAFVGLNMKNWHNFLTPGRSPTLGREADPSDNALTAAAYEQNRIKLTIAGTTLNNAYGIAIFATPGAACTPAVGNSVLVKLDTTIAEHTEYWTPPKAVEYTFDTWTFSTDGKHVATATPQTATPA